MKARLISVLLVIALLVTVGVIAAQAAPTSYSNDPDGWNAVYAAANGLDFSTSTTQTCPACGTEQTWTKLTSISSATTLSAGHYYLDGDVTNSATYTVSGTTCVHLNNHKLSSSTTVMTTGTSTSVNITIMGEGNVTCTSDAEVLINRGGYLHLCGGVYENAENSTAPTVYARGRGTRRLYIFEGADINGTVSCETGTSIGPSVYMQGGEADRIELSPQDAGFTGNMSYELTGSPVIGELVIPSGRAVNINGLEDGASIGINAVGQFTKAKGTSEAALTSPKSVEDVSDYAKYFHAVDSDYQITVSADNTYLQCTEKAVVATCDICGNLSSEWAELPDSGVLADGGHYKVTADKAITAAYTLAGTACVRLDNANITSNDLAFDVAADQTLNIMGTGVITGAATTGNAATINNAGTLNLHGGTVKHAIASTLPTVYTTSAVVMKDGAKITVDKGTDDTVTTDDVIGYNVHLNGGTFTMDGGEISNATAEKAGNVFVQAGTFTLNGGDIKDGTATGTTTTPNNNAGGNIHKYTGNVYINGGTVSGGEARYGGNIYIRLGTFNMTGGTVTAGHATTTGGNIYFNNLTSNCNFNDCTISNGTATYGGNIRIGSTSDTAAVRVRSGVQITGGTATRTGGSIFVESGMLTVSQTAQISGGEAGSSGGTIMVVAPAAGTNYADPVVNVLGGTHTGGSAVNGGFLFAQGGTVNIIGGTFNEGDGNKNDGSGKGNTFYMRAGELLLDGGTFNCNGAQNAIYLGGYQDSGDDSEKDTADDVYYIPTLTLGQHADDGWQLGHEVVINGTDAEKAIELNGLGVLNVLDSFDDTVYVSLNSGLVPAPYYGETVLNATSSGDAATFTGKLYLGNRGDMPQILPATYEVTQDEATSTVNGLVVAGALKDGAWTTTADAFENATESIKLYETGAEVTLPENFAAAIDLNGKDITINGSGVVTATNSKATDASTVTLGEGVSLAQTKTAVWNTDHFDVVLDGENGAKTVHRLELRIKSISLRPSTAGLYYTSEIVADSTLKGQINEIGVALSVGNEGTDFTSMQGIGLDDASLTFVGTTTVDSTVNSVLVNNILKTGEDNAARAKLVVHGAPAVVFENGDYAIAAYKNYARSYSINTYMELANTNFSGLSDANKEGLQEFYNTWKGETGWSYATIESWVKTEAEA